MAKLIIKHSDLPKEVIQLKSGPNRLGRSSENDFQIQHGTISRFHCVIEVKADQMLVRDLDSSNGTFVNDQPVGQAQLETGHILRLGDVPMEVKDAPEPEVEGRFRPCANHPELPASMKCTKCKLEFCGACIHILKLTGGKALRLCPACSGHCEPLGGLIKGPKKNVIGGLVDKLFGRRKDGKAFHE